MTQRHFPILKQSPPQTGQFKKKNYLATAARHHGCPDTWCPRKFSATPPPRHLRGGPGCCCTASPADRFTS